MDEEANHHESDYEELVKQYVQYHDAVSFHREKRRLLYHIHLLSNYPSSTGTGPSDGDACAYEYACDM
jgi:hypothetical protein